MMEHTLSDQSKDREYFVLTPQLVWALCEDPYEYTLWSVIKMVAGDTGECMLSTEQLATMAMMSAGKASACRKRLIAKGLLLGEVRKDPGYPQPVWHLTVPDLWERNIKWRQAHHSLLGRVQYKREQKSLHVVKPSSGEGSQEPSRGEEGTSPGEEGTSPGETKKILKEDPKEEPGVASIWSRALPELAGQFTISTFDAWIKPIVPVSFDRTTGIVILKAHNEYARQWLSSRLNVPIQRTLAGVVGADTADLTVVYQGTDQTHTRDPPRTHGPDEPVHELAAPEAMTP